MLLCSQLRSEFERYQQHAAVGTGATAGTSLDFSGHKEPRPTFQRLGGDRAAAVSAREAAAAAAELRAKAGKAAADRTPQEYAKGQAVLYRQRDGTWVEAKVRAVLYD